MTAATGSQVPFANRTADDAANRLAIERTAVRRLLTARRRAVLGLTVSMGVVVLFAMGTAASEVQRFALTAGFGRIAATALDPVVGLALLVLVAVNAWIADAGREPPATSVLGVHFAGAATLATNCWPSVAAHSWDGALLHLIMPGLLIIFAAAAPKLRRILADIIADLRAREDDLIRQQHQLDLTARLAEEVATAEAAQAHADADAAARAAAEQAAAHARWAEQEESRRRLDEAREMAALETARIGAEATADAARIQAQADAEVARLQAQADLARAESDRAREGRRRTAPAAKPTAAAAPARPSDRLPSRDEAARIVAELMRAHEGPEPFVLDWRALSAKHGGAKTFWWTAQQHAGQGIHLAEAVS